jgi:hypothetical protein
MAALSAFGGRHGPDQAGAGHRRQQEAKAFDRTERQQQPQCLRPIVGQDADEASQQAGDRDHGQSGEHASPQPDRVGSESEEDAKRHARDLHQRKQEAGFDQPDAEARLKSRHRRRQLADMQGGGDTGSHNGQRATRDAGAGSHSTHRCPQRRSYSRIANRSVMPAI